MTKQSQEILMSPLKALSDPTRLKILLMLEGKARTVGEIVDFFDLSQPTITRHLQALAQAGLVKRSQKGRVALYEIDSVKVGIMCLELTKCFPCCCETVQVQAQPFTLGSCCDVSPAVEEPSKQTAKKNIKKAVRKKPATRKPSKSKGSRL